MLLAFFEKTPEDILKNDQRINILGKEYKVEFKENLDDVTDPCYKDMGANAVAMVAPHDRKILVLHSRMEWDHEHNITAWNETLCHTLRHEVLHAFLYECGLWADSHVPDTAWAFNEEMIDWFAIMSPRILDTYKTANII